MKLLAEIDSEKRELSLNFAEGRALAEIDGRRYELEASEVEPNVWLFKLDNKIYQIYAAPNGVVNVGANQFEVKIVDPKKLRGGTGGDDATDGAAEIKTAMPGKIVRILVEQGAEVKHGDGVIVVEAMKMQNEMKSPKDGVVKEIRVKESATVNAGEVLVIIE